MMSDWNNEWDVAVNRAILNNAPKVQRILDENPYIRDVAAELRKTKNGVLDNIDSYISRTEESVKRTVPYCCLSSVWYVPDYWQTAWPFFHDTCQLYALQQ